MKQYKSQAAKDAQQSNYGNESYWDMLEETAFRHAAYFKKMGREDVANEMITRSLGESLQGNDGE